jgi:hypothetical protein
MEAVTAGDLHPARVVALADLRRPWPPEFERPLRVLRLLLSSFFDETLAAEHLADLQKSGLREETIRAAKLRSVPPDLIARVVGFSDSVLREVRSALLFPYPDPRGGFMPHPRIKVFPALVGRDGHQFKYLQPRGTPPRLYFPSVALDAILRSDRVLWCVEGEKKALSLAQLDLPVVGLAGIEGWHRRGSTDLLPDFQAIPVLGRTVKVWPDGDWRTNPHVARGVERFAEALSRRGARVRLVIPPDRLPSRTGSAA